MGFYGNITNAAKTAFVFDKVYANRYTMDSMAGADEIYLGRYVLVSYENDGWSTFVKPWYLFGDSPDDYCFYTGIINEAKTTYCIKPNTALIVNYKDTNGVEILQTNDIVGIEPGYHYCDRNKSVFYVTLKVNSNGEYDYALSTEEDFIKNRYTETELIEADESGTYNTLLETAINKYHIHIINGKVQANHNSENFDTTAVYAVPIGYQYNLNTVREFWKATVTDGNLSWKPVLVDDDSIYLTNYNIDQNCGYYQNTRGYDSTVWQKAYINGYEHYIQVAELNTVLPTFAITADPPTLVPTMPHYDANSTNTYYKLHYQPTWGFRIKNANASVKGPQINNNGQIDETTNDTIFLRDQDIDGNNYPSDEIIAWKSTFFDAVNNIVSEKYFNPNTGAWEDEPSDISAAIYYNKEGFSAEKIKYSTDEENCIVDEEGNPIDNITIQPSGYSGNIYINHDSTDYKDRVQIDTQELSMMLPSLGDSIARMWNLVYGDEECNNGRTRNLDIYWEDTGNYLKRAGLRLINKPDDRAQYNYNTKAINTLAGCINTAHDLIGMVITPITSDTPLGETEDASIYNENYIYYDKNNYTYYRKQTAYEFIDDPPIEYIYTEVTDVNASNYVPNLYYLDNEGKIIASDDIYDSSKIYYMRTIVGASPDSIYKLAGINGKLTDFNDENTGNINTSEKQQVNYWYSQENGQTDATLKDFIAESTYYPGRAYYHITAEGPYTFETNGYTANTYYYLKTDDVDEIADYVLDTAKEASQATADYVVLDEDKLDTLYDTYKNPYEKVTVTSEQFEAKLQTYYIEKIDEDDTAKVSYVAVNEDAVYSPTIQYYIHKVDTLPTDYSVSIYVPDTYYYYVPAFYQEKVVDEDGTIHVAGKEIINGGHFEKATDAEPASWPTNIDETDIEWSGSENPSDWDNYKGKCYTYYLLNTNGDAVADIYENNGTYEQVTDITKEQFDNRVTTYYIENTDEETKVKTPYIAITESDTFNPSLTYYIYKDKWDVLASGYNINKGNPFRLISPDAYKCFWKIKGEEGLPKLEEESTDDKSNNVSEDEAIEDTTEEDIEEEAVDYTDIITRYRTVTVARLKTVISDYIANRNNVSLSDITDLYVIEDSDIKNKISFYAKDNYHYLIKSGSMYGSYILDHAEEYSDDREYYTLSLTPVTVAFFEPDEYYLKLGNGNYTIALEYKKDVLYYIKDAYYVKNDSLGIYTSGAEWNPNVSIIPPTVELAKHKKVYKLVELQDFAREVNTLNGLILKVNRLLEAENSTIRNNLTVKGLMNQLQDICAKFATIIPNKIAIIDDYGRITSAKMNLLQDESDNTNRDDTDSDFILYDSSRDNFTEVDSLDKMRQQWITANVSGDVINPSITIHHNFQPVSSTSNISNKNTGDDDKNTQPALVHDQTNDFRNNSTDDTLRLYTPLVDKMGHIVGNNLEVVTLPYGFKTINSGANSTITDKDLSSTESKIESLIADNSKDTFSVVPVNQWIQIKANDTIDSETTNILQLAHMLITPVTTNKDGTDLNDGTDTLTIKDMLFDTAGHLTANQAHTYTLPYGYKTITINNNGKDTETDLLTSGEKTTAVIASSTQDSIIYSTGNKWIELNNTSTDTDKIISIAHKVSEINTNDTATTPLSTTCGTTLVLPAIEYDVAGHITSYTTNTYTLPNTYAIISDGTNTTEASATEDTLTLSTDEKLSITIGTDSIAFAHNEPIAVTLTTTNVTPGFGSTFIVPDVAFDTTGHKTALTSHTVTIPDFTIGIAAAEGTLASGIVVDITKDAQSSSIIKTFNILGNLTLGTKISDNLLDSTTLSSALDYLEKNINKILPETTSEGLYGITVSGTGETATISTSKIPNASTSAAGLVQLSSDTTNDSETLAATSKVIKDLKGLIDDKQDTIIATTAMPYTDGDGKEQTITVTDIMSRLVAIEAALNPTP